MWVGVHRSTKAQTPTEILFCYPPQKFGRLRRSLREETVVLCHEARRPGVRRLLSHRRATRAIRGVP